MNWLRGKKTFAAVFLMFTWQDGCSILMVCIGHFIRLPCAKGAGQTEGLSKTAAGDVTEAMRMHKNGKWAKQILSMQDDEKMWGSFHSLSSASDKPMTTEQALRRLQILGFTMEDECIRKAVRYLDDCLRGRKFIPDPAEKLHDWTLFTHLMFSAWIRRFTRDNDAVSDLAKRWAQVVTAAFVSGEYDHEAYISAYITNFSMKPRGGRLVDFSQFYMLSLLAGELDAKTQQTMVRYILNKPDGIYYVYEGRIAELPDSFEGKKASRYLGAIELLAGYEEARDELAFIADWLEINRNENGRWDMGKDAKDGVYFPLSDDWRKKETREADCTERVERLMGKLRNQ